MHKIHEIIGSCEATHVSYCKSKTHVVRGATNVVFVDLMGLVATHYTNHLFNDKLARYVGRVVC